MVAVEEMTNAQLRGEIENLERVIANRRDLFFHDVSDKQIIGALLRELGIRFAEGYLYRLLQEVANKARRRGLLNNPIRNESYSTAVGNTERMKPSAMGWAQTQGILVRELHEARIYLRNVLSRRPHIAAVAGPHPSALCQPVFPRVGPRNGVIFYDRGRPAASTRATP